MRAEKAIRALLVGSAGLTALVPAESVWPGQAPQGASMPAIVVSTVSAGELTTIDALAGYGLARARVSVVALARDYASVKQILEQVRVACNYQRGTVGGVTVVSVIRDIYGPDDRDDDLGIFMQSLDFQVTYREP